MTSQAPGAFATTIGQNIRAARKAAGMTQRQLANKLDTDPVLVSKWERARHRPNDENLFALARECGVEPSWFYMDHEREAA
jgi:transcriptional regulator with XRE-family HTH domain